MASLSHHYGVLKSADLIRSERRGQSIVYSLNTTVFEDVASALAEMFHVERADGGAA
jgi:DNA-binding transcriptional ArsR family regulator